MYPYTPQTAQPGYSYPQPAAYAAPRPAPGSAVTTLVLTILVFAGALLLSPLTILFSIGVAYAAVDPGVNGPGELIGIMIVAFLPLGAPAILGAFLAMHPRTRMPREFYPSSGIRTTATVFLVLHLLTLLGAIALGLLPQILVL